MDDAGPAMSQSTTPELRARFRQSIDEHQAVMESVRDGLALDAATQAAGAVIESLRAGGKVILFGNGGSAADAMHLAAEFLGRFLIDRRPLPALALADNHSAVTAIGNDYGYLDIFSRQVQALGRPGDVAFGLSTSGRSPNVAAGLGAARAGGLVTVAMTGADSGIVGAAADILIAIPTRSTPRVQEAHLLLGHSICEVVEQAMASWAIDAHATYGPAAHSPATDGPATAEDARRGVALPA
jgi:D-sedoheptulose 7-phosphate isomerase